MTRNLVRASSERRSANKEQRQENEQVKPDGQEQSGIGPLRTAAQGCPVGEGFEAVTVFPGELAELRGVEVGRFVAEEGFEAPLDVGAVPGAETVAARSQPVELKKMPHQQVFPGALRLR